MAYRYNQSYKEKEDAINKLISDNGLTGTVPEFRYNKSYKEKEDILNAIMTAIDPAYALSPYRYNMSYSQKEDYINYMISFEVSGGALTAYVKDEGVAVDSADITLTNGVDTYNTTTDVNGQFTINDIVAALDYTLTISKVGVGVENKTLSPIFIVAGSTKDLGDIHFEEALIYMPLTDNSTNLGTGGAAFDGVDSNMTYDTTKALFNGATSKIDINSTTISKNDGLTIKMTLQDTSGYAPYLSYVDSVEGNCTFFYNFNTLDRMEMRSGSLVRTTIEPTNMDNTDVVDYNAENEVIFRLDYKNNLNTLEVFVNGQRGARVEIETTHGLADQITKLVLGNDLLFGSSLQGHIKDFRLWDRYVDDLELTIDTYLPDDYITILCGGQSNMRGFQFSYAIEGTIPDNVLFFDGGELVKSPITRSFGNYNAWALGKEYPDKTIVCILDNDTTFPGQAIEDWTPGGFGNYEATVAATEKAISMISNTKTKLDLFQWHQGESNAGNNEVYYTGLLNDLVNNLRAESFGELTMPFVCGQLSGEDPTFATFSSWIINYNTDGDSLSGCALTELNNDVEGNIQVDNIHYENLGYYNGVNKVGGYLEISKKMIDGTWTGNETF